MFKDSNIILFMLCILPIIFYSAIIFANSPSFSIRLKTSFMYLYTGLLSITLLQFIFFIFPHIQDYFFEDYEGSFTLKGNTFSVYQPTLNTLLLYAFIQVALLEEFSKWLAFKCIEGMRGKKKKNLDHPYAIMFYSSLVAAAFAIVENIQYASKTIYAGPGYSTPEHVLAIRAISSVIIHMTCGLFMGYYIARSKGAMMIKKILFNIIGISAATFMHGVYDFNLMKPETERDYFVIAKDFPVHISSVVIILFSLAIAFLMSWHLRYISHEAKKQ